MVGCGGHWHLLPANTVWLPRNLVALGMLGAPSPWFLGLDWRQCTVASERTSIRGSCAILDLLAWWTIATTLGPLEDSWQGIDDFQVPMGMGPMVGGRDAAAGAIPQPGFGAGCLTVNS